MTKLLAITAAVLLAAGFTATDASAKKMKRGYTAHHGYHYGHHHSRGYGRSYGMMPRSSYLGAAMSGNHGNSAYGRNSLGHIEGGNVGGGK